MASFAIWELFRSFRVGIESSLSNPAKDSSLPRITFIFTPDGIMHVSSECSIPKFLFGYNARLPSEDETLAGLQMISEYAITKTSLDFDAVNATVSIAHFAKDIQLGEPGAFKAIGRLSRIKLKGLQKHVVNDTTVYFKNKSREIRIYPKLQEVYANGKARPEAIEAARGNLRFEYCLLNKYGIDSHVKRIGLPNSNAKTLITQAVSDSLMSNFFGEIDFPDMVTNNETNLGKLKNHFSGRKAMTLTGFLATVHQYGEGFFKDPTHNFKKGAYYRAANDCKKAGVWNAGDSLE